MKRLPVHWSLSAYTDLFEIVDFIKPEAPQAACRVGREILRRGAQLGRNPLQGAVVPELHDQGVSAYRQIIVLKYRVIYEVRRDEIAVHLVVDSRRNLADLLIRRLLR